MVAVASGVRCSRSNSANGGGRSAPALMATISYLIAPIESPPRYGLDHEFGVDSPEFLTTIAGATGVPFTRGNRIDLLNNGDEFYPVMLREIAAAQTSITIEAYIYWEGKIGRTFAQALAERAARGRQGEDPARRHRVEQHRRRHSRDSRIRRLPDRLVQPDQVVHDRPVQQPDAPQVAHHRRACRLHGRRRHCRPVAGARAGRGPLARHADSRRGSGRHAAADGICPELARTHARARVRPDLLPGDRAGGPASSP